MKPENEPKTKTNDDWSPKLRRKWTSVYTFSKKELVFFYLTTGKSKNGKKKIFSSVCLYLISLFSSLLPLKTSENFPRELPPCSELQTSFYNHLLLVPISRSTALILQSDPTGLLLPIQISQWGSFFRSTALVFFILMLCHPCFTSSLFFSSAWLLPTAFPSVPPLNSFFFLGRATLCLLFVLCLFSAFGIKTTSKRGPSLRFVFQLPFIL